MTTPIETLKTLTTQADHINDRLYLAIQKKDPKKVDRAGRDLVNLGNVLKDLAAQLKTESERPPRTVYFVLENHTNNAGEFIPLVAKEDERGYYTTDWVWGKDFEAAVKLCEERNARAGIDQNEAARIVCGTMGAPQKWTGSVGGKV